MGLVFSEAPPPLPGAGLQRKELERGWGWGWGGGRAFLQLMAEFATGTLAVAWSPPREPQSRL